MKKVGVLLALFALLALCADASAGCRRGGGRRGGRGGCGMNYGGCGSANWVGYYGGCGAGYGGCGSCAGWGYYPATTWQPVYYQQAPVVAQQQVAPQQAAPPADDGNYVEEAPPAKVKKLPPSDRNAPGDVPLPGQNAPAKKDAKKYPPGSHWVADENGVLKPAK